MQEKKQKKSIAIIGSGITGLSASWLLRNKYNVTLFEKNDYLGGHTHTHDVIEDDKSIAVDSGFIVYNEKNYPNLVGLFDYLNVETQKTDMSFAFSLNQGELEYAGSGISGMFAQRGNLIRIKHWRLLQEIVRFNKVAHGVLGTQSEEAKATLTDASDLTLGEFLEKHNFSKDLQQNYLLPMGAAIWSCPIDVMTDFPAYSFLRFFANHGLIDLKNRPQWRTVVGGSREYIFKMMDEMRDEINIQSGVLSVDRTNDRVIIKTQSNSLDFDYVIFACHADEAHSLLGDNLTTDEHEVLGAFSYQENKTYLHTDESLMPKRSKAWCSWNYLATTSLDNNKVTATYWMNRLQRLTSNKNYLVTLNPFQEIEPTKIIKQMTYHHPVFHNEALRAQKRMHEIQGKNNAWFCGSYCGYGFHEDALASSVNVCQQLGVTAPWYKSVAKVQENR